MWRLKLLGFLRDNNNILICLNLSGWNFLNGIISRVFNFSLEISCLNCKCRKYCKQVEKEFLDFVYKFYEQYVSDYSSSG